MLNLWNLWKSSSAKSSAGGLGANGAHSAANHVPAFSKIALGCGACHQFVRSVHRDGIDRGAITSFGNNFAIETGVTPSAYEISSGLTAFERKVSSGRKEGTALYDGVVRLAESVSDFELAREHGRIGLMLIVTDGVDMHSQRFAEAPERAGRAFRNRLSSYSKPWIVLLFGVGRDVDRHSLGLLAQAGEMRLQMVDDMATFGAALNQLGTQIRVGMRTDCLAQDGWAVAVQRPFATMSVTPYDYVFLIDRSGSMQDAG